MPIYCGTDIIEIDRIKESVENVSGFRERVYTKGEIEYCEMRKKGKYESYAARFAAKEAVMKALGTGMTDGLGMKQIEVQNDSKGKPHVILTQRAMELFQFMGARNIDISLSHCGKYAIAYVVIEA